MLYGSETDALLTDAQSSVLSRMTTTAGSAAVKGNQVYSPYGSKLYSSGSMPTNRGYTGQYKDATGLNYDNARYYDSVVGQFISADPVQGNPQGMDPYTYVNGNPETLTDPTGNFVVGGFLSEIVQAAEQDAQAVANDAQAIVSSLPAPVQDVLENPIVDVGVVATAPVWVPFVVAAGVGLVLGTVLGLAWNDLHITTLGRADMPYHLITLSPPSHSAPSSTNSHTSTSNSGGGGGGGGHSGGGHSVGSRGRGGDSVGRGGGGGGGTTVALL